MRMKWGIILSSAIVFVVVLVVAWGQVISRLPLAPLVPEPDHEQAQALEALESLRSVTHVGVTYSNYSNRLADTAVIVDRYLRHAPKQQNVRMAMAAYQLAMEGWEDTIRGRAGYDFLEDAQHYALLASCLGVMPDGTGGGLSPEGLESWRLARENAPKPEWRCAEMFLDAAEKGTK